MLRKSYPGLLKEEWAELLQLLTLFLSLGSGIMGIMDTALKIPAGADDLKGGVLHSSHLCGTKGLNKMRSVYRNSGLKLDHRRAPQFDVIFDTSKPTLILHIRLTEAINYHCSITFSIVH